MQWGISAVQAETAGRWVTLAEAGAILGCSVDTVRRRVKQGAVHAEQRTSPRGAVWYVRADTLPSMPAVGAAHDVGYAAEHAEQGDAPLLEVLRQLEIQRDQLLHLAGQVGFLQAQLQQRDEQLRALQAPATDPETAHAPESAQEGQQGASAAGVAGDDLVGLLVAPRRPWWRFW
jgi:hypothetical protein